VYVGSKGPDGAGIGFVDPRTPLLLGERRAGFAAFRTMNDIVAAPRGESFFIRENDVTGSGTDCVRDTR
jgi:hypothetical protein